MKNLYLAFIFLFPFLLTALGAIFSAPFKRIKKEIISGFACGVMFSASVWSLIIPAINASANMNRFAFLPACIGVVFGAWVAFLIDVCLKNRQKHGNLGFFWAVTLHNIPEGLAVGFAYCFSPELLLNAFAVAMGIGIQNFPEGLAVALSCEKNNYPKGINATTKGLEKKPFQSILSLFNSGVFLGVLSGVVEPISALIGALLGKKFLFLNPYVLSLSAGVMIYVILCELIFCNKKRVGVAWAFIVGFCLMMSLDVALG